jgi:hypothetical protein
MRDGSGRSGLMGGAVFLLLTAVALLWLNVQEPQAAAETITEYEQRIEKEMEKEDAVEAEESVKGNKRRAEEEKANQAQETLLKNFHKEHYDPKDVVAQVLNYSDFGKDVVSETDHGFWYAKSKCVYAKAGKRTFYDDPDYDIAKTAFEEKLNMLDLNKVDPRTVKIGMKVRILHAVPFVKVGDVAEFNGGADLLGVGTILDEGRLERGWALVFSQHCKGTKNAF